MTYSNETRRIGTELLHTVQDETHFHQELEILYVIGGEVEAVQDDRTTLLQKEDVLVINSNHAHALQGRGALSLLQIHVDDEILRELFPGGCLFFCNSALDAYHPYGEVRRILRQFLLSYTPPNKRTGAMRYSLLYELLDTLANQFQRGPDAVDSTQDSRDEQRLQQIIRYVNTNFREQINLGKLAERMYLSTSSLSRLFKKKMGCYFADFVTHVRLNYATKELGETEKTLTRIATDCGFTNLAAFNKQFQAVYHTTPAAYRKEQQAKNLPSEEERLAELARDIQSLQLADEPQHTPGADSTSIMIAAGPGTEYRQSWNQVLNGGAAHDLTICNVQGHIAYLCKNLKFRYVRIWNLFSGEMTIVANTAERRYNFDVLDNVLDFMTANHMIPYLDFGPRPSCAVKAEGQMVYYEDEPLVFENPTDWMQLFRAFINHIVRRYGQENTAEWVYDFSVDVRTNILPFCKNELEVMEFYKGMYSYLHQYFPQAKIGGPGSTPTEDMNPTIRWLEYCKQNDCVPHHLSVLVFPYKHHLENGNHSAQRLAREHNEQRQIRTCRELLDKLGLPQCRLFVVEWNNTLSTRCWLNDSCFRAAYALEVLNQSWGVADVMATWMATDWCCSYYDTVHIANGGNGILSKDGIRKPLYHALDFLNRMSTRFLQKGEHYLATTNGAQDIYILCYNFKRYSYEYYHEEENEFNLHRLADLFEDDKDLQIHISLTGLNDKAHYALKRRVINDERGSLLGEWSRFEYDAGMDARDVQYLRNICNPELSMRKQTAEKGEISFDATLKPHEIALFHIFELRGAV